MATTLPPVLESTSSWNTFNPRFGTAKPARTSVANVSIKRVAKRAALVVALLLLNKLGVFGAGAFFLVLVAMSFYTTEMAFIALVVGMLGLITNPALAPKTLVWTPCRIGLLFLSFGRLSIDLAAMSQSLFTRAWYLSLCLFGLLAAASSIISGYFMHIALLKLLLFMVGMSAVFAGETVLQTKRIDLNEWVVAIVGSVVANGFLVTALGQAYGAEAIGTTEISGLSLYRGPFYHANTCGPFSAILAILMFATWTYLRSRGRWICLALVVPLLGFMWASGSRTGLFSLSFGMLVLGLLSIRGRSRFRPSTWVAFAFVGILVVLPLDFLSGRRVSQAIQGFVRKYDVATDDSNAKSLLVTRQGLIDRSLEVFWERPLTGLGFEVSTDPYFVENATLFTAPIEKGFLPTALLEEVGILGTCAFVIFMLSFSWWLFSRGNDVGLVTFTTFLTTNLGEVTVFSFGGSGAFGWLVVAMAILIGETLVPDRRPLPSPGLRSLSRASV